MRHDVQPQRWVDDGGRKLSQSSGEVRLVERVWLSVGSNQEDPARQVDAAAAAIACIPETRFVSCSSYYESKPVGMPDQPDFLNAVIVADTALEPETFMHNIHGIEQSLGRRRTGVRWGPRTIDIDIVLFGNRTVQKPEIIIPHYDMHNRRFVLLPLVEVSPFASLPDGRKAIELLKSAPHGEVKRTSRSTFRHKNFHDRDAE